MKRSIILLISLFLPVLFLTNCVGTDSKQISPIEIAPEIDEDNPHFLKLEDARYIPSTDFDEPDAVVIEGMSELEYYTAFVHDLDDSQYEHPETNYVFNPHDEGDDDIATGFVTCVSPLDEDGLGGVDWDPTNGCICNYTNDDQPVFFDPHSQQVGCQTSIQASL